MAKEGSANFEIPAEMRAFAEKSVEQAKQAFDSFISAAQHAVNTAENQAASARTGAKEVGRTGHALCRAQRRVLVRIRPEAAARQGFPGSDGAAGRIRESQIAALTEQAKELSKQAAKMAGSQH